MKKYYFLGLIVSTLGVKSQTTIFNQPTTTTDGIVSDVLSNGNFVAAADDFTLPLTSKITKIKVQGFQNQSNLETTIGTGAVLYIYANNAGSPAGIPNNPAVAPIASININKGAAGYNLVKNSSNYTYEIDFTAALSTPVILQQNTVYWLVFAPKTSLTAYTAATRFNWFAGSVAGNAAKLVDPSDAFGAGATTWTDISTLTASAALDGLAFSIEGETAVLGTSELYSSTTDLIISPNPTTDYLQIKSKTDISNIEIFDITGRKVNAVLNNDKVDVRNLQAGSYIINIETKEGKKTKKFIKK